MVLLDTLLADLDIGVEPFALCEVHHRWRIGPGKKGLANIHYVLAGHGVLEWHNGTRLPFEGGSMLILPVGVRPWVEPAGVKPASSENLASCRELAEGWRQIRLGSGSHGVMLACGAIRATYRKSVGLFDYLRDPIVEHFPGDPNIRGTFCVLLREMADPQPGSRVVVESILRRCLVMLLRRHCASGQCRLPWLAALESPKLGRAVAAILSRPKAHHTLASLAETAGMSRSAFSQQFATSFGRPAIEFLREVRLRHAARQLASTDLSVKAVAGAVGIRSRSYFWRAFKELYGVDPTGYRAHNQRAQRLPRG